VLFNFIEFSIEATRKRVASFLIPFQLVILVLEVKIERGRKTYLRETAIAGVSSENEIARWSSMQSQIEIHLYKSLYVALHSYTHCLYSKC
jgi:hypothetical protein